MVLQKLCFTGLRGFEVGNEQVLQAQDKDDKLANILKGIAPTIPGEIQRSAQTPHSSHKIEEPHSAAYEAEQTPPGSVVQSIELESIAEVKSETHGDELAEPDDLLTLTPEEIADGAIALNPKQSHRQYWTDPATGVQREIWRPGDGDGDKAADYFDKPGRLAPLEKRWRFYQSATGMGPIKRDINEPPKYVILDDRTVHELLDSDMARTHLKQYWGHDFGSTGIVRARRPHRGRSAIKDAAAAGDAKYHSTPHKTNTTYYFTGEKDYAPIVWRTKDPALAIDVFKPPKRGFPSPPKRTRPLSPNKHGHNQFTPKDQMVKYGAPHKGASFLRYRNRVNAFLPRDKTPPTTGRKTGMSAATALNPVEASQPPSGETADTEGKELKRKRCSDEFMFVGQSDSDNTPAKKNKSKEESAEARLESGSDEVRDADEKKIVGGEEEDDDDPLGLSVLAEEYVPHPVRPLRIKVVTPPDFFTQMLMDREESEGSVEAYPSKSPDGTGEKRERGIYEDETQVLALQNRLQIMKAVVVAKDARIRGLEEKLKNAQDQLAEQNLLLQPGVMEIDGDEVFNGEPEGGNDKAALE